MKTIVRTAVMTLAFAGLVAPSINAKTVAPVKSVSAASSFVGYPAPMCLPGTGDYCGLQ